MVTKCHKGKVLPIPGNEAPAMIRHPAREHFHRGEPAAHAEQRIFPLYHWFQCKLAPGRCATSWVCEWPRRWSRPGIPEEIHRSPMCNTLHFMSIACYIDSKVNDHDPRGKLSREDNLDRRFWEAPRDHNGVPDLGTPFVANLSLARVSGSSDRR
jgi:hypothetical protein